MSLASSDTLSNSGLWNSKRPAVTLDMVSTSLSPMNGDSPDSLQQRHVDTCYEFHLFIFVKNSCLRNKEKL